MDIAPHVTVPGIIRPAEDRRALLTFATDRPISDSRPDTTTILDMSGCDLSFLRSGQAPLLADHRAHVDAILGVVEDAFTDDTTAQAVVRFGTSPAARAAWDDVLAGIIMNVSCGLRITGAAPSEDPQVVRASHWWPYEVSLVAVPADVGARVRGPMSNPAIALDVATFQARMVANGDQRRRAAIRAPAWRAWAATAASSLAAASGASVDSLAPALGRLVDEHLDALIVG